MEEVVNLLVNNGMAAVIVAYFLYKDYKFNGQILAVLSQTSLLLSKLEKIIPGLRGVEAGED